MLRTSSSADLRMPVIYLTHRGRGSCFNMCPFTHLSWWLCNIILNIHTDLVPLAACMCSSTCAHRYISSRLLAVSQWNRGMLPNVFGFQSSSPLSFPDSLPLLSFSHSLSLCLPPSFAEKACCRCTETHVIEKCISSARHAFWNHLFIFGYVF